MDKIVNQDTFFESDETTETAAVGTKNTGAEPALTDAESAKSAKANHPTKAEQKAKPKRKEKAALSLYGIVKWAALLALLICVISKFAGSGETLSATEFAVMSEAVVASADVSAMEEADLQMIKRLYGLTPSDYDGVLLYYPASNMGAEELLLVKLKDPSQQQTVQQAIEARIATQKNNFDGYGVDQYEMLEQSIVEIQGNYALLAVGTDAERVRSAFLNTL